MFGVPNSRTAKTVWNYKPRGCRAVARPRKRWLKSERIEMGLVLVADDHVQNDGK